MIDVTTHSLSVGVLGGGVRRLIPKNTRVPAVARDVFLPGRHGQESARIPVFQGESDYAQDCTRLGEVVLSELKGNARSDVPIEVTAQTALRRVALWRATEPPAPSP